MRTRMVVLVVPILLIAAFVAFNWSEFLRPVTLSLGLGIFDAPLGMIMLGLLTLAVLGFLVSTASMETDNLLASRQHARDMAALRELADKAEVSRFTELRALLNTQVRDQLQREEAMSRAFTAHLRQSQQELQLHIDQNGNSLAAAIGELEDRLARHGIGSHISTV